jgi:hypothetical protein
MTNIDATLMQQIFHVAKGQRKPDIQHYRQANYLRRGFEIAKWIRLGHIQTLQIHPARLKRFCSNRTSKSNRHEQD